MEQKQRAFEQGADILPEPLRAQALSLDAGQRERTEEIRLRVGQPLSVVLPEGERPIGDSLIHAGHLEQLVEIGSCASVHSVLEQLREGFLTIAGGHRVGFCGTAVVEHGQIRMLRDLSSASIRLARQFPGISLGLVEGLLEHGRLQSTLILAPPGGGKTSLLRDLIRSISSGACGAALRVGVVDQRGELGAVYRGRAQLDLGRCTDILCACPKEQGLMLLLRSMNPQVLAVDEVTSPEDVQALAVAAGCGVTLLATAHAGGIQEMERRPVYRTLLKEGIFRRVIVIQGRGSGRSYKTEVLT